MSVDLTLARKRFDQAQAFEEKQQRRELDDLAFYEGEGQWPADIAAARQGQQAIGNQPAVPARPMLTIDKVREPIRHVVNDVRASDLGVEIAAADDFGDETNGVSEAEIELREGLVRRIQRESHAIDARVWAAERAIIAGRGYYGVITNYLPGKTFDKEVKLRRFYNQGSVLLDPTHEQPDGSDIGWGFVGTWMSWEHYKAEYPRRKAHRNTLAAIGEAEFKTLAEKLQGWFQVQNDVRSVRVVEYWDYILKARGVAELKDGSVAWEDELTGKQRDLIGDVREDIDKQVKFFKLDGGDSELEETDWPGRYIPLIKVLGEEIQPFDRERRFEGMVRPSRGAQRGYNYMVNKWVEMIGLTPVPPLMMTPEMVEGFSGMYTSMATRNWPVLYYNAFDPANPGRQMPPPLRPPVATDIQAVAGSVSMFDQAIKSTTAIPDATLGNVDLAVRSGRGIQALALNALKATAHFGDNFARSVNYEGHILNDLLFPIYGRRPGRLARLFTKDRETKTVRVGLPARSSTPTSPMMPMGQPPTPTPQPQYQLTKDANFNVTIKVTKNYDTMREQEASTLQELVTAAPEAMIPVVGDLWFKYQDGPGHREIADRMKLVLRPEIQAALNGGQQTPEVMQLKAQVAQLTQLLQTKQAEGQIKLQQTSMQEQAENQRTAVEVQAGITKAEIAAAASMANAQAKVDAENFRSYVDALETRLGKVLELHMGKLSQQLQQAHEHGMQAQDHAHEHDMATRQHAQALELGDQGHQQALEQGAQAAALQPEPTEGAEA